MVHRMKMIKRIAYSSMLLVAYVSSFSMMVNVQGKSSTTPIPRSSSSSSSNPPRNIAIVGGTHGNEYTGVWVIKSLQQQQLKLQERYANLNISTILGNPEAHYANRRFIHTDLNREFSYDKLCELPVDDPDTIDDTDSTGAVVPIEAKRARELNDMLGSKCATPDSDETTTPMFDVAIDLHSTTSNMGTTLIINEGDVVMAQGAAYVTQKCPDVHCLMHAIPDKGQRPNLSSTTTHGFTIEVGPVPQGLLRHDAVMKTECALFALLDFLQQYYASDVAPAGTLPPALESVLHQAFPDGMVPAFRTIPAQRHGEMSGKISWPSDEENPNFPQWMIHESVQDQDYQLLRKGDPLFVQLDGTVLYYDGSYGDEIYLLFINEGGYYYPSSGTGISVALKTQYHWATAVLDPIQLPTAKELKEEL